MMHTATLDQSVAFKAADLLGTSRNLSTQSVCNRLLAQEDVPERLSVYHKRQQQLICLPHCKATWQRAGPGSHGIVRLTIWTGTVCDTTMTRRRSRLDICTLHVVIIVIIMDEEGFV
jgi:hypothetical protein